MLCVNLDLHKSSGDFELINLLKIDDLKKKSSLFS